MGLLNWDPPGAGHPSPSKSPRNLEISTAIFGGFWAIWGGRLRWAALECRRPAKSPRISPSQSFDRTSLSPSCIFGWPTFTSCLGLSFKYCHCDGYGTSIPVIWCFFHASWMGWITGALVLKENPPICFLLVGCIFSSVVCFGWSQIWQHCGIGLLLKFCLFFVGCGCGNTRMSLWLLSSVVL